MGQESKHIITGSFCQGLKNAVMSAMAVMASGLGVLFQAHWYFAEFSSCGSGAVY